MAPNIKFQDGRQLTLPVPSGKKSGDPVAIGGQPGVCLVDRLADGTSTVKFNGVAVFALAGATFGVPVYYTTADGTLSLSAGAGKTFYGTTLAAAAATTNLTPVLIGGTNQTTDVAPVSVPMAAIVTVAAADPTAGTGATPATVAEADAPAGGTGAAAGGWDTAAHRDTAIALINSLKVQVNLLVTLTTDLKARQAEDRTSLVEFKTKFNDLLAKSRTAGLLTP